MLELRGVSKVYGRAAGGRVEALLYLSFEVKPTELAVLVGPGGSGKSTLLRLVAGEERPTRGTVLVDGVEVGTLGKRGLARLRRSLGILFQDAPLLPDRTALGNVTFVLRALGMGRAEAREQALAALVDVGLGPARNALPDELAAGERRRVLLARVLALPGFGKDKARIFVGLLGKRLDVRPPGWEQVAADWPSIAYVDTYERVLEIRERQHALGHPLPARFWLGHWRRPPSPSPTASSTRPPCGVTGARKPPDRLSLLK